MFKTNFKKIFFSLFSKKALKDYYTILTNKPSKINAKFLINVIRQNSKYEQKNKKYFENLKNNSLNDLEDEEFLGLFLAVFILIFFI